MNHNSEYHLIEKYTLLENFEYWRNYLFSFYYFFTNSSQRHSLSKSRSIWASPGKRNEPYIGIPSHRKINIIRKFWVLTELSFFPSTIFSPILLKGIPFQNLCRFELARVRRMKHNSEYHLIEKYKLLENVEY
jgi:hypothetical protein